VSTQQISVSHNAEIAHRLSNLPGKCQNIHGHSLLITIAIEGEVNDKGILAGIDFGTLKKAFREYIDENYDHHLLLNAEDFLHYGDTRELLTSLGAIWFDGDPTVENLARWIGTYMYRCIKLPLTCNIEETNTNGANWIS
jgi:6-pyruvoyl-tetrahydropterin synthase